MSRKNSAKGMPWSAGDFGNLWLRKFQLYLLDEKDRF